MECCVMRAVVLPISIKLNGIHVTGSPFNLPIVAGNRIDFCDSNSLCFVGSTTLVAIWMVL